MRIVPILTLTVVLAGCTDEDVATLFAILFLLALITAITVPIAVYLWNNDIPLSLDYYMPLFHKYKRKLERSIGQQNPRAAFRRITVDLAHAHHSDDMALAIEIWRRPDSAQFTPDDLTEAMDDAEGKRESWMGARVNPALKKSWRAFLDESFEASRGDYIVNLDG